MKYIRGKIRPSDPLPKIKAQVVGREIPLLARKKKAIAGPTKLANGVGKYFSKKHFFFEFFNKKNSQLILLASQQFLLAKIIKTLQFFFNFFWFFAIFFAGFEKKKGHQNLLANRYFLLAKIQKFPKMCSQKKTAIGVPTTPTTGIPYIPIHYKL